MGHAQNISRYYTSSFQPNGALYFLSPRSAFTNSQINSKLVYDITYLTTGDSATVNFSYFDKSVKFIDSIVFVQQNKRLASSAKKIFIAPKKSKWHLRYSARFSFNDLIFLFEQQVKPQVILITRPGEVQLNIKSGAWKKKAAIVSRIFEMIKINREK